jgi:hypothetical protein
MTNAVINNIVISEDELYNRVKAYGAGDGINRAFVTVEDASSITAYGVREVIQEFSDAITFEEVEEKALEFLDFHKEPVTEIDVTFYFDVEKGPGGDIFDGKAYAPGGQEVEFYRFGDDRQIRRGDIIRIVSQTLNLNTTGIVEELSWQPGSVNLSIGQKRYNLIDVIKGPDAEQERKIDRKSPEVPLGLRAQTAEPGVTLFVNPYFNTNTVGIEVYIGETPGFAVSRANLLTRGPGNRFDFNQLQPGNTFYFRVRAYDNRGNFSPLSEEVSALAGAFPGEKIEGGTIDLEKFIPDARPILIVPSLPFVPPGSTIYPVGMLVNFLGSLYRLVSQTNTPATDWVRAIDTGSVADGAITTGKIAANTITANNIDAASVRSAVIVADTISTNKLQSGNVIFDNGSGGDGRANRIRAVNNSNVDQVVMGFIQGKAGVPSGVDYGFWGTLGTGLFIQGALQIDTLDYFNYGSGILEYTKYPGFPNPQSGLYFPTGNAGTRVFIQSVFITPQVFVNVPSGQTWYVLNLPTAIKSNAEGKITITDWELDPQYIKIVGPASVNRATFSSNFRGNAYYNDNITDTNLEINVGIIEIVLKSYS